jgi:NADH:ubiquinone oxidoreductase subunit 5 (subunit L)/multisubunit Na+/H+ antiporter MnhA subunit
MYAFIPGSIFLGVGILLYRREWKKMPEDRNKANIMLASYACIIGVALGIISVLYWGEV